MPQASHIERHFTAGEVVRDVVIGMSDGLTVPFALAAGLSGAVDNSHIVVVAGLAEVAAGSIAMGLGGYLAAKSDAEHYASERLREAREVQEIPEEEAREIQNVFADYGLSHEESGPVVQALTRKPKEWVDFMMRFELGLEEPDPKRALQSALTIAGSYIAGGIIPLSPYMALHSARTALNFSVVVTLIALAVFGYIKGRFTGARAVRSASQTVVIGGLAAGAAFLLAKLVS
ncbi:MAG: VIT1/CCC1 transporter family protein [Candidatus Binataceae bacterium]